MSPRRVAIVGSGMIGSTLAFELANRGVEVTVFERGPDYPYPPRQRFVETVDYDFDNPVYSLPRDLTRMTSSGSYRHDLSHETVTRVGGSGTAWTALATRMAPNDFHTRSRYGFSEDWPIDYDTLEPYLCRAEAQLGVSGSDDANPWAPARSRPYPLPPFEMTDDDALMAERLERGGIHMHSTPQARARRDYDGRPACMNIGLCHVCPTGSRYTPTVHLQRALATGRCRLHTRVTVRRVVTDGAGRARAVVCRPNGASADREHGADVVIIAGAAFESARLLLLSRDARHPDGLGNDGGHVGRHLAFHHIWNGHMHFREQLFPGRVGFWTGQSDQFCDPPTRGRHGGVKLELPSRPSIRHMRAAGEATSFEDAMAAFEWTTRCRQVGLHAESNTTDDKRVTLSKETDRFGDPVAHVHYVSSDFDHATYAYARGLFERVAKAAGATDWELPDLEDYGVFAHYMGVHRMGTNAADSVVDTFGAVHGTPGLYAIGLGMFAGSGGAVNPTLTGVALALRASDFIARLD